MLNADVWHEHPSIATDEVGADVMIGCQYHTSCCWRSEHVHSHHCQSNCSLVLFWLIFQFFICVAWNSLPSVRCKSVKFPLSYRNIVCCLYCAILSHKVYVLDVQVLLLHVKDHTYQFDLASFFRCLKMAELGFRFFENSENGWNWQSWTRFKFLIHFPQSQLQWVHPLSHFIGNLG